MAQQKILILKLATIDTLPTGAIATLKVASLAHKLRDDAVERALAVPKPFLVDAQLSEVLRRAGDHIRSQLHDLMH